MITVKDLMSRHLYTLEPTDTVHHARELMINQRIHHIPIVDVQQQFVGLVTKHDILEISISALAEIDVKTRHELESSIPLIEIMTIDIIVAEEETSLLEAAKFMLEQRHGCLPILKEGRLTGILTESDFVKLALHLLGKMEELEK